MTGQTHLHPSIHITQEAQETRKERADPDSQNEAATASIYANGPGNIFVDSQTGAM